MPAFVRQTAIPCTLSDIAQGLWVESDAAPGVQTGRGLISRASILGVIIEKGDRDFAIDDGTNTVSVRVFDSQPIQVRANVGDIVLVIGRPRQYNGERYLALEICKKIRDTGWVQYRKAQLLQLATEGAILATPAVEETPPVTAKNPYEAVVEFIRAKDTGSGAELDALLQAVPDAEKYVQSLIEEGEIFELRPGRLKVLE